MTPAAIAFLAVGLAAQTRPRADQLLNLEQIRIGNAVNDPRPGTLVPTGQIADGRYVETPNASYFGADSPDVGKPTVCLVSFYRITVATWPGHNVRSGVCFTQYGLSQLLLKPEWRAWWDAHKPPGTPEPDPTPHQ